MDVFSKLICQFVRVSLLTHSSRRLPDCHYVQCSQTRSMTTSCVIPSVCSAVKCRCGADLQSKFIDDASSAESDVVVDRSCGCTDVEVELPIKPVDTSSRHSKATSIRHVAPWSTLPPCGKPTCTSTTTLLLLLLMMVVMCCGAVSE